MIQQLPLIEDEEYDGQQLAKEIITDVEKIIDKYMEENGISQDNSDEIPCDEKNV